MKKVLLICTTLILSVIGFYNFKENINNFKEKQEIENIEKKEELLNKNQAEKIYTWGKDKLPGTFSKLELYTPLIYEYDGTKKYVTFKNINEWDGRGSYGIHSQYSSGEEYATTAGKHYTIFRVKWYIDNPTGLINEGEQILLRVEWEIKQAIHDLSRVKTINNNFVEYKKNKNDSSINFTKFVYKYGKDVFPSFNIPVPRFKTKFNYTGSEIKYDNYKYDGRSTHDKDILVTINMKKISTEVAILPGKYTTRFDVLETYFNFWDEDQIEPYTRDYYLDIEWEIVGFVPLDLSNVKWGNSKFIYDGSTKEVKITGLPKEIEAKYNNNSASDAGDYNATVSFKYDTKIYILKNDNVSRNMKWEISKANYTVIPGSLISSSLVYSGKEQVPIITGNNVKYNIISGKGKNVGSYTLNVEYINPDSKNYNLTIAIKDFPYSITKANYDMKPVSLITTSLTYNGKPQDPGLKNIPTGVIPAYKSGRETNVGNNYSVTYSFTVSNANYNIPADMAFTYKIKPAAHNMGPIAPEKYDFTYNGNIQYPKLIRMPDGVGYEIAKGNTHKDVGEYTFSVNFTNSNSNYYLPVLSYDYIFYIRKAKLSFKNVALKDDILWYNGKVIIPELINIPEESTYKIISGDNNIKEGSYELKVSYNYDRKNYEGIEEAKNTFSYTIMRKLDISNLKWVLPNPYFIWDNEEKEVYVLNEDTPEVTFKYTNNKNKNPGIHEASMTLVYNTKFYQIKEGTDKLKRNIKYQIIKQISFKDVKWNDDIFYYDGFKKTIKLNKTIENIEVKYINNEQIEPGKYDAEYKLVYDIEKYMIIENTTPNCITYKIIKRIDLKNVKWSKDYFKWDGKIKKMELENIPKDIIIPHYTNNEQIEPGRYELESFLEYNKEIYELININFSLNTTLHIQKEISFKDVKWTDSIFMYDGHDKKIELKDVPLEIDVKYEENIKKEPGKYFASYELFYDTIKYLIINNNADSKLEWKIVKEFNLNNIKWNEAEFLYDGKEKQVYLENLPKEITPIYDGILSNLEPNIYEAKLLGFDYDNEIYIVIANNIEVIHTWKIKRIFDLSDVIWDSSKKIYDGKEKSVNLIGLPKEINPKYDGNFSEQVGKYEATAILNYNKEIYEIENIPVLNHSWKIIKILDLKDVKWGDDHLIYDGSKKEIRLINLPEEITPGYTGEYGFEIGEYMVSVELIYDHELYEIINNNITDRLWAIIESDAVINERNESINEIIEIAEKEKKEISEISGIKSDEKEIKEKEIEEIAKDSIKRINKERKIERIKEIKKIADEKIENVSETIVINVKEQVSNFWIIPIESIIVLIQIIGIFMIIKKNKKVYSITSLMIVIYMSIKMENTIISTLGMLILILFGLMGYLLIKKKNKPLQKLLTYNDENNFENYISYIEVDEEGEDEEMEEDEFMEENEEVEVIEGSNYYERFNYSIDAKLHLATKGTKIRYDRIKNYLLSYKGMKVRKSWRYEVFKCKGKIIAKFWVNGRIIDIYGDYKHIGLENLVYKYVGDKAMNKKTPIQIKILNDLNLRRVICLLDEMLLNYEKNENYENKNYIVENISKEELIKMGLIRIKRYKNRG